MPIDRRISNGLAWAGALVVVAIPAADAALRQFGPQPAPQVAVVEELPEKPENPGLPTPSAQRPQTAAAAPREPQAAEPDPVRTATVTPRASGDDAVENFLSSGRPLPSYISNGSQEPAGESATTEEETPAPEVLESSEETAEPAAEEPEAEAVAALPRQTIVTFPTPVSERPPSVPRAPVVAQPPLVIGTGEPVVTASDLEDWESGPLSEFLARRQGGNSAAPRAYDAEGFFLDEWNNGRNRRQGFPPAYEDGYYPFE